MVHVNLHHFKNSAHQIEVKLTKPFSAVLSAPPSLAQPAADAMVLSILYVLVVWTSFEVFLLLSSPVFLLQRYHNPYLMVYQRARRW
ncbi:Alpha-latrotoxin-Lt1a [Frankliniella fusca]|uniref:Alpha-latrotoxin-Lt1a n=1 Tax=Frankliniella fusca TaxID=407009 RepID=A0AAE1HY36_9NEOP|nr:Alpha-latrotoxin-Lt1a [Frankliniella fusca]